MNLSAPERPVLSSIGRDLVQWTTLDPMAMPVRAVSRSYRSNEIDNERLYISEAIRFLQQAPAAQSNNDDPTRAQLQMLIARLELREQLLGGFVTAKNLSHFGEQSALEHEKIRSRNWELLRQCAERTGLYFEPLDIGAGTDEYGVLWFPNDSARPAAGVSSASVWKILNIRDPWADPRIRTWRGLTVTRPVDSYGSMLSPDAKGTRQVQLIPLGVYSLSYPKLPLLLIDFRDQLHVRRHEMTQRSINEIAAGIIGISHFTNWYYYVGLDLYEFIASRHGSATDQAARLDCYAAFRSDLLLDHNLPGELRRELEARVNSLSINPMGAALARDFEVAQTRYEVLQANSEQGGRLTQRLEKDRRAELARYSESPKGNLMNAGLHTASLGIYTHRRSSPQTTLAELDRYRRAEAQINFLESVASSGTAPEVAYESTRIQASISELRSLMPEISSRPMLSRASSSLERIKQISRDSGIQSECTSGLIELAQDNRKTTPVSAPPPIVTAPAGEMTTDLTIRSGLDASRAVSAFK
ncbi:MAG: hypothetical protein JO108_23525 [Acidobacteriaceae bacterium]|nr:hypothetical protein [Acidobacteriaceae bacterium]